MISSQFIQLWNHCHNPVLEHFRYPPGKNFPHAHLQLVNTYAGFQPLETLTLLSVYIDLNLNGHSIWNYTICSLLSLASLLLLYVSEVFPCGSMYWQFSPFYCCMESHRMGIPCLLSILCSVDIWITCSFWLL